MKRLHWYLAENKNNVVKKGFLVSPLQSHDAHCASVVRKWSDLPVFVIISTKKNKAYVVNLDE